MPAPAEDRPRLRPIEGYPVDQNGQKLLALRDPSGLSPHVKHLTPIAVAIIQLCDGRSTRTEICAEFQRRYKQPLERATLDRLLAQLDEALLLDSPTFRDHSARIFGEYGRAEARPPLHAGKSYPATEPELRALLDKCFEAPHGPGRPAPSSGALPKAMVAPHIDFNRGGPAYAWAYRALAAAAETPELIVIFGTDHNGGDHPFILTRKHYDTPLGRMTTDVALVDLLRERGGDTLLADEYHHRGEHSIEFQAVWLRYVYGARLDAIPTLPVLCGSIHDFFEHGDPAEAHQVGGFLRLLVDAVKGRRVLWLAGADLAHVGPRFGDEQPLDASDRDSLERRDQATLKHVAAGDAAGWFGEIKRERDARRVCGLTPIYALLAAAQPGKGALTAYGQCPAEQGSIVSIASFVYG
jgi:AmmeMemoRadiSam system protein B